MTDPRPRRPPKELPDSLPKRDEGTDVAPDDVRDADASSRTPPPDSLPRDGEDTANGDDTTRP